MYSERVTKKVIESYLPKLGFEPRYHSVSEVEAANSHLQALFDFDLGKTKRPLEKPELEWIYNERFLSKHDFRYYISRYCWIRDWRNRLIRFTPNVAQNIAIDVFGDMEEEGRAIALQQLKGRQIGVSTLDEHAVKHRAQFYSNVNAIVGSSDPDKSRKMAKIMELCWGQHPWWMMPVMTKYISGEVIEFGRQNSAVSIQHGTQFSGIARGDTPTVVHLCLSPESLIPISNGRLRRISEVRAGDFVLSSSGNREKVKRVAISHRRNEAACELWLWGNQTPLVCTRDHPILTGTGFVPCEDISKGDRVLFPVRPIRSTIKEHHIHHNPPGRWGHRKVRRDVRVETLNSNFDTGWMCGLYLSEGSIGFSVRIEDHPDRVTFCVHEKEIQKTLAGLSRALGMFAKPKVSTKRGTHSTSIRVNSSGLARWLVQSFGHLADKKTIPDWVWDCGEEFVTGLICGYLEGDGYVPRNKPEVSCCTISSSLAIQFRDLLASSGYGWASIYTRKGGFFYGRNCREMWTLMLCGQPASRLRRKMGWSEIEGSPSKHWNYSTDGKFIEIGVFDNRASFSETFYDLEVESEEHDFCTIQCCVKNSELPDYDDPKSLVDAGLLMAMHESPEMLLLLESTAAGIHNWWHNAWVYNKQNYHLGRSRLCPMFLPYFVGRDIYPTETWLRSRPIPTDWVPEPLTVSHAERCTAYVRSDRLLKKHLGEDWSLPREQMWFWEVTRQEYKDKGELAIFYQELASDDHECFQSSNQGVFDTETISVYREATREPVAVFGFVGHTIPVKNRPSGRMIDVNRPPLPIVKVMPNGKKFECTLYPLKFTGYPTTDFTDKLFMWETPQEGSSYGLGVDTADGIGLDRTVIEVIKKGDYQTNDIQVAEFASAYISALDVTPIVFAVANLYSTKIKGEYKQPRAVIECNRNGELTQNEMRKMGWGHFHPWMRYDNKRLRASSSHKIGWYTNVWSRAMMMDTLTTMIRGGWLDINSPWFVDEMADLERDERMQSARAAFGGADDRIIALGIVLFSLTVMAPIGSQRSMSYKSLDRTKGGIDLPMYNGGAQTWDVMEGA